ncbi:MAG TPA: hypothetical protein DHV62_06565 [Elusimicrobia bacterium]|nr:hypothetical protein [Elusimicrobiota bacterium]
MREFKSKILKVSSSTNAVRALKNYGGSLNVYTYYCEFTTSAQSMVHWIRNEKDASMYMFDTLVMYDHSDPTITVAMANIGYMEWTRLFLLNKTQGASKILLRGFYQTLLGAISINGSVVRNWMEGSYQDANSAIRPGAVAGFLRTQQTNNGTGIKCYSGSQYMNVSTTTFSGCTTNYYADAATYASVN